MSDKESREPKEREEYMKESKENLDTPPPEKEGIEEPKVTGLPKVKMGVVIFVIIVLIILVIGISSNMFGLFSN